MGLEPSAKTAGVPVYENAGRCRPRRWIHGVVPWVVAQRLCRTATRVKTADYSDGWLFGPQCLDGVDPRGVSRGHV